MFGPDPVSPVAIVLDAPSFEPLEPLLDALEDRPVTAAIGPSLLAGVGPSLVQHLRNSGLTSVLDLRLFDAPHRMAFLAEIAARAGVSGLSIQLSAGEASLLAAKRAARGRVPLIGVLSPRWQHDSPGVLAQRAEMAQRVGIAGLMGTPAQLKAVSAQNHFRLRWATSAYDADDQIDVPTIAQQAHSVGATTLFLGRSVLMHASPGAIMDRALHTMREEAAHGR